ncbi:MAG: hypothetical protein V7K98_07285 [Nostoc sp.]|uniref:hypothetical protein n=1 Tax=Nostoc sp. TaxID=1180 RepID=UPI002FF54962
MFTVDYCCIEAVGKILLDIGIRCFGLVSVILTLAAEELLVTSERIVDFLLVEFAESLNGIVEDEFEDTEVILSVF